MRIIGGKNKGRTLKTLDGIHTRPTLDKVRGAVFNSLYDVSEAKVLDFFGGSGAMALEAISRGAEVAVIVDNDKEAMRVIGENVKALQYESKTDLRLCDFHRALKSSDSFDLIFLDPPYGKGYVWESMELLVKEGVLETHSMVVAEIGAEEAVEKTNSHFMLLKEKQYGRAKILFYRFDEE